jgi:hypothetical protein
MTTIGYYEGVTNRLHHRWQTPHNKLDISLTSGGICDKLNKFESSSGTSKVPSVVSGALEETIDLNASFENT